MTSEERIQFVCKVLYAISNMFREEENNRWKNIFEQILKSRDLIRELRIDKTDVIKLFAQLEKFYSKVSYFWMQRGLLKQYCKEYDE